MNFTDFKKELAQEFNLSERTAKKILVFIQSSLRDKLISGYDVYLHKIGTFKHRILKPKKYLNLQTGKTEISKKRFQLAFKVTESFDKIFKKKTIFDEDSNW